MLLGILREFKTAIGLAVSEMFWFVATLAVGDQADATCTFSDCAPAVRRFAVF